jgi:hypothetical protein
MGFPRFLAWESKMGDANSQRVSWGSEELQTSVSKAQAREYFTPLTLSADKRVRVKAIRALLALAKNGRCNYCYKEVENYNDLYRWHFDHLFDLQDYSVSPVTQIHQFRISGNAAANHRFATVMRHGLEDTQLLCKNCHYLKNRETFYARQQTATGITRLTDQLGLG